MASQTMRNDTMKVPGLDAPGVGKYEHERKTNFGYHQIQGGAPNNFLILTKNP